MAFHSHTRSMNFSRPRSCRVSPSLASSRSTTFCVAMPAWSLPGTHSVGSAVQAVIADQRILDRGGDGMAQVQHAGDVGRRHGDHKRLLRGIDAGLEIASLHPPAIQRPLDGGGVIGSRHFLRQRHGFHAAPPSPYRADKAKRPFVYRRRKGASYAFRGATPLWPAGTPTTLCAVTGSPERTYCGSALWLTDDLHRLALREAYSR